jgi:hypothetical protein
LKLTELETRLQRAFAQDAAPAGDPLFRIQVILRRRQAQLRRHLVQGAAWLSLGAALAPLVFQAVDESVESTPVSLGVTALLALAGGVLLVRRYLDFSRLGLAVTGRVRWVIARYRDLWWSVFF